MLTFTITGKRYENTIYTAHKNGKTFTIVEEYGQYFTEDGKEFDTLPDAIAHCNSIACP